MIERRFVRARSEVETISFHSVSVRLLGDRYQRSSIPGIVFGGDGFLLLFSLDAGTVFIDGY
jgi:hypothetical protein